MLKNIGKRLFAMFGIPEGLASNGGLEFTSYDANSTALTKGPSAKLLSCLSTQQLPYRVCCENNQTYDQEYSGYWWSPRCCYISKRYPSVPQYPRSTYQIISCNNTVQQTDQRFHSSVTWEIPASNHMERDTRRP